MTVMVRLMDRRSNVMRLQSSQFHLYASVASIQLQVISCLHQILVFFKLPFLVDDYTLVHRHVVCKRRRGTSTWSWQRPQSKAGINGVICLSEDCWREKFTKVK